MKHLTEVTSRLEAVRQSGLYVNGLQLKNTCIKHLLLQFPYLETILKEIDRGWCFLDANFNAYSVVRGLDSQNFLDTN
jgi:exonuclease VII small subunit